MPKRRLPRPVIDKDQLLRSANKTADLVEAKAGANPRWRDAFIDIYLAAMVAGAHVR